MKATEIIKRCNDLRSFWAPRNKKFSEWYKLVQMVDELEQENMESFVGNDPRAAYNLVTHMLDAKIPHRIPAENLDRRLVSTAAVIDEFLDTAWRDVAERYRLKGRQSFMRDFIGLMIATGWYSIFSIISADGTRCVAELWNPAQVYPSWDDELVECAHIFELSPAEATRMAARSGWSIEAPRSRVTLYDYWHILEAGKVYNSVVLGSTLVKPATQEVRFTRIPIFIAPVGGLPDLGVISTDKDDWKEEVGQPSIATNANIYRYWNKWWTFQLQILRDTAQPKILEKSRGATRIVKPEDVYKRGTIWRGAPEDSIDYVNPPPIPVELRSGLLDMEAMLQRGGPSWAMFGAVQQQLTSYVISQITASAHQMSKPYHQGVIYALTDIDNFWLGLIRSHNYKPYGYDLPLKELPQNIKASAEYELRIPGDWANRATAARMLNPDFKVSELYIYSELFPEVKNPIQEMAKIRAEQAQKHPLYATIALISAFREESRILTEAGDVASAELYTKAADMIEATLEPQQQQVQPQGPPGVRPEVMPPAAEAI